MWVFIRIDKNGFKLFFPPKPQYCVPLYNLKEETTLGQADGIDSGGRSLALTALLATGQYPSVTTGASPVKIPKGLVSHTCETSVLMLASVHTSEASELIMVGFTAMVGLE